MNQASGAELRRVAAAHLVVTPEDLAADRSVPDDAVAHHLRRVLRLRDGDLVTVTDGRGSWRPCRFVGSGPGVVLAADGAVEFEPANDPPVVIASAIPKGDRLEWMVQKTTECGVDRLVLLECDRSVVRWKPDRAERQLGRLGRIVDEAVRQSRRVWRPEIVGPVPSADVLPHGMVAEPGGERPAVTDRPIVIGPEGGWSTAERGMISLSVDLGPSILRTETAAIVATALCVVLGH